MVKLTPAVIASKGTDFKLKILKISKNELIITLLAVGTYLICLLNDFHTDDWIVLSLLRDGFSLGDFVSMENAGRFRPLTNVLLYMRYLAFRDTAWLYYLLNILLHGLISVLFYRLLIKLELPERTAMISALFFAVYFQHYEAVLWLYGTIREFAVLAYIFGLWHLHEYLANKSRKSLWLFAAFSFAGLFVVEDFVVAPLIYGVFALLFTKNGLRSALLKPVVLIGLIELVLYFSIRSAVIDRPGITENYYYPGFHMVRVLFEYLGWFIIPSPAHPYFKTIAGILPQPLYYLWRGASYLAIFGFIPLSAWLFVQSSKQVRFFILFIFIAMLPIIPLNYKVGPRNIYITSLGLAVMVGYILNSLMGRPDVKNGVRKLVLLIVAVYLGISIAGITITSLEYRKTQRLVAGMIDDMRKSGIDLNKYDYVLLDGLPGRTIVGPSMIYRLNFKRYIYASNDPIKGYINIREKVESLYNDGYSFCVFDYRHGHMIEATEEYMPKSGSLAP